MCFWFIDLISEWQANEEKIGLLEKHKDYVDRAKAFHKKKEALRVRIGLESYILIC
jgi:hypothetical protein